jgi:hypothetical protein
MAYCLRALRMACTVTCLTVESDLDAHPEGAALRLQLRAAPDAYTLNPDILCYQGTILGAIVSQQGHHRTHQYLSRSR